MTPFILTRDLCKTYQKGTVPIPVLQGVSLEIAKGEYVSVVGRSGSGKSTLLNLLGGLDTATSGRIVVGDSDVTSMSRRDLAVHRRSTVGMIFQSFNLIPSRTALENITLARALERDLSLFGSERAVRERYESRYIPGERFYLERCRPRERADAVVRNDEPANPVLEWRCTIQGEQ